MDAGPEGAVKYVCCVCYEVSKTQNLLLYSQWICGHVINTEE
jgi:hypothetical protein